MTTTPAADTIRFLEWHKPSLEPGEYTIQVQQHIVADGISDNAVFPTETLNFSIQGERFALPPTEVHAVFPPNASMGDHAHVLPHVVLRRSTLPWERHADPDDKDVPWLALLVFHEGERVESQTMSLEKAKEGAKFHADTTSDDQLTVIDVKKDLLATLLPTKTELTLLTHARIRGEVELAAVIANRLPKAGGFSTAHLVSLEGRYTKDGFDFQGAGDDELIRLVSLVGFRFGCFDPKRSFTKLLRGLDGARASSAGADLAALTPAFPTSTLRLTKRHFPQASDVVEKYLAMGSVPMRHSLRNGQKTASWYHGPLAPAKNPLDPTDASVPQWPMAVADELLRFHPDCGMLDTSYAAAWELGRLLALQSTKFSLELRHWKEDEAKRRHPTQPRNAHPLANLSATALEIETIDAKMPPAVRDWMADLSLLEAVPFSYLVPDERMLPLESMRIFHLDWLWIECLLDGAFGIGSATEADKQRDAGYWKHRHSRNPHGPVTGVILRSEVVSGWPGLQVDGYGADGKLKTLRTERLSPSVLICLFAGVISKVKIHQKVETLHFGLDFEEKFIKKLREEGKGQNVPVPWKDEARGVLDVDALAKDMGGKLPSPFTSAEFALQMIEGVEEVTFECVKEQSA